MNPEVYDGYRTAGQRLGPVADWYINQLAEHGWIVVLAVQASVIVVLWCAASALLDRIERRRKARRELAALGDIDAQIDDLTARINDPAIRARYLNPDWEDKP